MNRSAASIAEVTDVALHGSADRYGDLCVHGIIDLRRSFSRDEIERAVKATVSSFPVLGCIYEPRFYRDRWVPSRAPISEMYHVGIIKDLESDTQRWTSWTLDPTRMRPMRVVLLPTATGCRLIFSISHLVADGAGMAAAGHVFAAHLYGVAPGLPVESRRDVGRALNGLSLRHLPVLGRDMLKTLVQPLSVLSAAPRTTPYPNDVASKPCSRQVIIDAKTVETLKQKCQAGTSVNDLLVAAVALTAAKRSTTGPVSVLYTMDLRRYSHTPHLSTANVSSIMTAIVPREAMTNIVEAAHAVHAVTAKHRKGLAGPAFLLLPMLLAGHAPHAVVRKLLPVLHPLMVDLPVSRGLVFTNVGKLDHGLGPLVDDIIDIRAVGPNMKGIAAPAIIAFGLHGQIHLELFSPPGLGERALDELERELREALSVSPDL